MKEFTEVAVDMILNPQRVEHFSNTNGVNANERLRTNILEAIQYDMTQFSGSAKKTAFEKAVRDNQTEVFAFLEEVLNRTFLQGIDENQFFMQFAEVRNLALGDAPEFYLEDEGFVTVSEVANGNWDVRRQKYEGGESFTVRTRTYAAKMYDEFFSFAMGRITFDVFVKRVADGFVRHLNGLVAGAFQKSVAELPTDLKATGNLDIEKLRDLVEKVEALSGSSAVVIGTRGALAEVMKDATATPALLTPEQIMDFQKYGGITYYQSMVLVQLPQVLKDNTFDFAYSDKDLFILPANDATRPVKIVVEGLGMIREARTETINQDQTFEYTYITRHGVNVIIDSAYAHYKLA